MELFRQCYCRGFLRLLAALVSFGVQVRGCSFSLVVITPYNSSVYTDMHIIGPAMDIAIAEIRAGSLQGCDIKVEIPKQPWQGGCDLIEANVNSWASKMYYERLHTKYPIGAFVGISCTFANKVFLDLLYYWNLLLLEGSSIATFLADRVRYPCILGFSYTHVRVGNFFYQTIKLFNWSKVTVIYNIDDAVWRAMFTMTTYFNDKTDAHLEAVPCYLTSRGMKDIARAVYEAHKISRIVFILGNPTTIRLVMLAAHKLGYTGGDNIYIAGAYFKTRYYFDTPKWDLGQDSDNDARDAYRSLFLVKQRVPSSPEYKEFDRKVQEAAIREYNQPIPPYDEVNIHAIGFHDAITTYGTVLNETLAAGDDMFDGRKMAKRFTNRTFYGIRGVLTLDENNDLNGNFELYNFRYNAGIFVKVVDFAETATVATIVADIVWPSPNGPPPNEPFCGFNGNNPACAIKNSPSLLIGICVGCLGVILIMTTAAVVYIKLKHQAADRADSEWWIVDPENFVEPKVAGEPALLNQSPATLIYIKQSTITKKTLMELKRLRTTKSDKLVRIFGIVKQPETSIMVLELCSRGSIYQLVRGAESFMSEWNFRLSILRDIIEGLGFIHHSWIYCHGRLRSSKCLVNSRFMVKITDYALQDLVPEGELLPQDQLWMAPELLRNKGPQEMAVRRRADVYSFGIIMAEICLLGEPYQTEYKENKFADTIEAIKNLQTPPKRPNLEKVQFAKMKDELLRGLAARCWEENPLDRPPMLEVHKRFQDITQKRAGGVVDDLIRRMARYADELENLVGDRTTELLEEKKKIQKVLFEILPRPIALDILAGHVVQPEEYDSVTILFNAVDGFHEISAKSTPIQLISVMHNLYSTIDDRISRYDVYKVETTGDVYLIASGLPARNGLQHVTEIGHCALTLRDSAASIKVPAEIGHIGVLKFVIGFHTGPIVTGVIGDRLPRYCLFGDTINTASRMESTSEGGKIQVSPFSISKLPTTCDLEFEPRGEIFVKGKGNMLTYWLMGRKKRAPALESAPSSAVSQSEIQV